MISKKIILLFFVICFDISIYSQVTDSLMLKKITLVGEIHHVKGNYREFFKIIKKSWETSKGPIEIILEEGPSKALLMNSYLQNSDKKYLNNLDLSYEMEEFLNEVRKFSKLNGKNVPIIRGVDFDERAIHIIDAITTVIVKDSLICQKLNQSDLVHEWKSFHLTLDNSKDDLLFREINNFIQIWKKFAAELRNSPNTLTIDQIICNYLESTHFRNVNFNSCDDIESLKFREIFMVNNLSAIILNNSCDLFFGLFGSTHIVKIPTSLDFQRIGCRREGSWNSMAYQFLGVSKDVELKSILFIYPKVGFHSYNLKNFKVGNRDLKNLKSGISQQFPTNHLPINNLLFDEVVIR